MHLHLTEFLAKLVSDSAVDGNYRSVTERVTVYDLAEMIHCGRTRILI